MCYRGAAWSTEQDRVPVVAVPSAARCIAHRYRDAWYRGKGTRLPDPAQAPLGVVMLWCRNAYALLADGEHEFAYTRSIDGRFQFLTTRFTFYILQLTKGGPNLKRRL